jgi:hypothetical protein
LHLEFVNVNFNPAVPVPDACIRTAFCFKKTLMYSNTGNSMVEIDADLETVIQESPNKRVMPHA